MSYSAVIWEPPLIDKRRIVDMCKLQEHRILNIYLYGSQVYGTNSIVSDFDFLVLACSLDSHKELRDGNYNVHIKTPDSFYDELLSHKMLPMECFFAPSFAKIQQDWAIKFVPDLVHVKRKSLSESHDSWTRGKRMILEGDMYRGMKSLWHSIRMLLFASQILEEGAIYDFSEANYVWEEIIESKCVKWNEFKEMLLGKKKTMEDIVREA